MPRVTSKGQVTIPKAIRDALGIEPGDEVVFEKTAEGYELHKRAPTTPEGEDPFAKYRGAAEGPDTMADRMRRLRGAYPRSIPDAAEEGPEAGS